MRAYTYSEIGMLLGTAIGGCLATAGFVFTGEPLFFLAAAMGMIAGILLGSFYDKISNRKENREVGQ